MSTGKKTELEAVVPASPTTTFRQPGSLIKRAIYELVQGSLNPSKKLCLEQLKTMFDQETDPVGKAVGLMVSLEDGFCLSAHALTAQALIAKAARLSREIRELTCIARNLHDTETYKVSLEEAQRYGLV